jgi:hypothetical protein
MTEGMVRYAVISPEGEILKYGVCARHNMGLQGEKVIEIADDVTDATHHWNGTDCVVKKEVSTNVPQDQPYTVLRKLSYPTVEQQLDILYHQGFDAWKEVIAEVKAKYPKPMDASS